MDVASQATFRSVLSLLSPLFFTLCQQTHAAFNAAPRQLRRGWYHVPSFDHPVIFVLLFYARVDEVNADVIVATILSIIHRDDDRQIIPIVIQRRKISL